MFRRYLLTGFVAGFLSISSTLYPVKLTDTRGVKDYVESFLFNGVYAGESEIILKDNTTASGLTVKEETANTTIARFRGDGNVGIGTTSPGSKLQITQSIGTNAAALRIVNGSIITYLYGDAGGDVHFDNSGAKLLLNESGGNVGIGTAGPDADLTIQAKAANDGAHISFKGNTGTTQARISSYTSVNGRLDFEVSAPLTGTPEMVIQQNGNVGIGTTSPQHPLHMGSGAHVTTGGVWTNASSREYKKNIRDLTVDDAMQTLDGLRPSRFNYKVDDEDEYVGFIAEDVPELVATRDRKGLSPMDLTAVITKVVQEQQRMLETQKEAMDGMKHEIEMLKSAMNYGVKGL